MMRCAPVISLGPVSSGTVVWRARGALYLTVVVKATFALVAEGRMMVAEPDPIAADEQLDRSGGDLRTAGDLAPYLGQPEIWLTGHAEVPPNPRQRTTRVDLAVAQAGAVRFAKSLDVDVAGAAGNPKGARIAGMGPVASHWPLRRRWLADADRRRLQGPVLDIPDTLHWEYFQTAPLDQRLASLRGDETLILGGVWLRRPGLRTQLPAACGAARLFRRQAASPGGEIVPLIADTLQVDVDRFRCSMLFRGRVRLSSEAELASLRLVAGLEVPGQPIQWPDPFAAEKARARFDGTTDISDEALRSILSKAATPFEKPSAAVARARATFAGTMDIPQEMVSQIARKSLLPFAPAPAPATAQALPGEPEIVEPEIEELEIEEIVEPDGLGAEFMAAMDEEAP